MPPSLTAQRIDGEGGGATGDVVLRELHRKLVMCAPLPGPREVIGQYLKKLDTKEKKFKDFKIVNTFD